MMCKKDFMTNSISTFFTMMIDGILNYIEDKIDKHNYKIKKYHSSSFEDEFVLL
jgi:hypothetical protein